MAVIRLYPKIPYNFHLSAMIFSGGDPQIRIYRGGIFRQVLEIQGTSVLVDVFSNGSTDKPEMYVTIRSDEVLEKGLNVAVSNQISSIFNIHEDLAPFYQAVEKDEIMTSLISQLRGVKSSATPTVFEALVDSIIEQQISLKAAHSVENRLIRVLGNSLVLGDRVYYSYPAPHILAEATDSIFRACGLTRRKGEYIREVSHQILSGALDLERFRTYSDPETVISELMEIRGVGRWTAELTLLRGLHRSDVFPADDIGIRRFISRYYCGNNKISSSEARAFAEQWGTWKGYAAYYLEIADLLGILPSKP